MTIKNLEAFAEGWNCHDVDFLKTFMAEDCVFETSRGPEAASATLAGSRCAKASRPVGVPEHFRQSQGFRLDLRMRDQESWSRCKKASTLPRHSVYPTWLPFATTTRVTAGLETASMMPRKFCSSGVPATGLSRGLRR